MLEGIRKTMRNCKNIGIPPYKDNHKSFTAIRASFKTAQIIPHCLMINFLLFPVLILPFQIYQKKLDVEFASSVQKSTNHKNVKNQLMVQAI